MLSTKSRNFSADGSFILLESDLLNYNIYMYKKVEVSSHVDIKFSTPFYVFKVCTTYYM